MKSELIGYFPKITADRPDWLKADQVREICSASNCISTDPEDWIDEWKHNENWVYSTEKLAKSVIKEDEEKWGIYAFKQFPILVDEGEVKAQSNKEVLLEPLSDSFEFLGFDAVSRSYGNMFECSPLSCNHGAESFKTNEFCLFETFEEALDGAKEFSRGAWEPGPYYVVEVYREKKSVT